MGRTELLFARLHFTVKGSCVPPHNFAMKGGSYKETGANKSVLRSILRSRGGIFVSVGRNDPGGLVVARAAAVKEQSH
jgi:hypothetical protein